MGDTYLHKVLLVGDEKKIRNFLKPALELNHIKLTFVDSGETAREITQGTCVQGIIASIKLKEDLKKCRIKEVLVTDGARKYYEMRISALDD